MDLETLAFIGDIWRLLEHWPRAPWDN